MAHRRTIPALQPSERGGHQFVIYGDCCSGVAGAPFERNFAAVNRVLRRLRPGPEFIAFAGDAVAGADAPEILHRQWRYFLDHEMAWLHRRRTPMYHATSNHDTRDTMHEAVWRAVFPRIPPNGPAGQRGLSYYVRRGNLLLVFVNTSFSGLGGYGHVECRWLNRVLSRHRYVRHKLVIGHHPIWPVNGYTESPLWCVAPEQGKAFWDVLVRHRIPAYLCSHIIAFDVQAHDGVLQITTGGAGTSYGPGGFMPGPYEYHHLVQAAIDARGLRYRVLDTHGRAREQLAWPFPEPDPAAWQPLPANPRARARDRRSPQSIIFLHIESRAGVRSRQEQTLACGWNRHMRWPTVTIALSPGPASRLRVHLAAGRTATPREWTSGRIDRSRRLNLELALHPGMGPGGFLVRHPPSRAWSSMTSASASGLDPLVWPHQWAAGHGVASPAAGMRITWQTVACPDPPLGRGVN